MSTPTPPTDFQSWLDYAIATMDARGAHLERVFNEDDIPSQDDIRAAAQEEFDHLKKKAVMPWIGMLENWQMALSKKLGRSAEDIVEGNLLATDFSSDSVHVQFEDGTDLTFRRAFYVGVTARIIDRGELPWFEIRALASIGAGLLMRHLGDRKAIDKLARLVAMEACSGAHHWARKLVVLGLDARIIPGQLVSPYRLQGKTGKNDANDAAAICEAASRPSMHYVSIKTTAQQGMLCIHRLREGFKQERTACVNRIRGLLAEFGIVVAQSTKALRAALSEVLEDACWCRPLSASARTTTNDRKITGLWSHSSTT